MKEIEYFMIPSSPWTYLGHDRLASIAARHGARINMKPFDLGRVFPLSGGLPLPKRAPQRQAYRLAELARWRDQLGVPLTIQPRHFPVPADLALRMIAAAQIAHGPDQSFRLAGDIMRACWAEEQDIADERTLVALANAAGMDGDELQAAGDAAQPDIDRNTDAAIAAQVFGSPWYRVGNDNFWGQDRLDFVDRALAG